MPSVTTYKYKTATHFTDIRIKPKFLILHHTASLNDCSNYLAKPSDGRKVSVHIHINRKGIITHYSNLIDFTEHWVKKAYHAGTSRWGKYENLNNHSIGIEQDGGVKGPDGIWLPFTQAQRAALDYEVIMVCETFNISAKNVLGHKEISPGRKNDPEPFDMVWYRNWIHKQLLEDA